MEPTQLNKKSNIGLITTIIVLVIVGGGLAIMAIAPKKDTSSTVTVNEPQTNLPTTGTASSTTPVADTGSVYKDGTYTAEGNYMSPGGPDSITVTLTLKNDVVTDATVVSGANDPTSSHYQGLFIGGFKQYVVGQNISALNLTKVSGSSLTPKAFNQAVANIEVQAKA